MAAACRGPVNAKLTYDSEDYRYKFLVQDYRVSLATRRKIAEKVAELDKAMDDATLRMRDEIIIMIIRVFASTLILAAAVCLFVVEDIQFYFMIGLVICAVFFWPRYLRRRKATIVKDLADEQKMVELELALLLRKDLARFRERGAAQGDQNL